MLSYIVFSIGTLILLVFGILAIFFQTRIINFNLWLLKIRSLQMQAFFQQKYSSASYKRTLRMRGIVALIIAGVAIYMLFASILQ